jgi:nucleotide-binding universal stress UspA family protein
VSCNEIVVGVDGSPDSLRALGWAAAEAARRDTQLVIAHAGPDIDRGLGQPSAEAARELVSHSLDLALAEGVACGVRTVVRDLPAVALLRELGAEAELVVVGSHGTAGTAGTLLGSVAYRMAAHAPCPVVVVGAGELDPAVEYELPVSVGVLAGPAGQAALQFAFAEAALRGVPVDAVRSWAEVDWSGSPVVETHSTETEFRAWQQQLLRKILVPLRAEYPQVPVTMSTTGVPVGVALEMVSRRSSLLVLGRRRDSQRKLSRLGSTSSRVIQVAACPVVIADSAATRTEVVTVPARARRPVAGARR